MMSETLYIIINKKNFCNFCVTIKFYGLPSFFKLELFSLFTYYFYILQISDGVIKRI